MDFPAAVNEAERRIRPYTRTTYVERSWVLSERSGGDVYLKLENLQHTGSFKARGAMNRILAMSQDERANGVIAASTGNHGAAVARAAQEVGVSCTVVVPENTDESKLAAIRRLGATITTWGDDCMESERHARRHGADHGMTYVSPYNDPLVIAGQGTVGLELACQVEHIDAVFVALGGGGLVSGISGYLKGVGRDTHIVACSPEHSAVMIESVRAGRILDLPSKPTLSDGTAGGVEPGALTFELCRSLVDEYVTVTEAEIADTLRRFIETHHILIEGAAAVAVASFERLAARFAGQTVAIVICGGNISLATLRRIL